MHLLNFKNLLAGMGTLVAFLLVLTYALLHSSQVAHSSQAVSNQLPIASVVQVGSVHIPPHVERFNGVVQAARKVEIESSLLARVEEMLVHVGDEVHAGQTLVRLDARELHASAAVAQAELARNEAILDELTTGARQQELTQAEALVHESAAALALKQSVFDRFSQANNANAISAVDLDLATHELQSAKARSESAAAQLSQLREGARPEQVRAQQAAVDGCAARLAQLQARIADTVLVAPFNGRIQSRFVDEGKIIAPGQAALTLVESQHLEVHVGLPPETATRIAGPEQTIIVEVNSQALDATLVRMAPALDASSGTRAAVFKLSDEAPVAPGEAVSVVIEHQGDAAGCWLPTSSLISNKAGGWAVLVACPSATEPAAYQLTSMDVTLLDSRGERCRVEADLEEGSLIVSQGTHRFVVGQSVGIRLTSGAAAGAGDR
ncbi:MAG: HlyD family efflux transporter periplasmic adaptor subunit [Pirellulaceae bacterium]